MNEQLIFEILLTLIVLLSFSYYHERRLRRTYQDLAQKRDEECDNFFKLYIEYLRKCDNKQLDLADAQFTGFYYGKNSRTDIIELIESMGLEEREWEILKEEYPIMNYLDENEFEDIENYFKNGNKE